MLHFASRFSYSLSNCLLSLDLDAARIGRFSASNLEQVGISSDASNSRIIKLKSVYCGKSRTKYMAKIILKRKRILPAINFNVFNDFFISFANYR